MMHHYAIFQALGAEALFKLMRVSPDGVALARKPRPTKAPDADKEFWVFSPIEVLRLVRQREPS